MKTLTYILAITLTVLTYSAQAQSTGRTANLSFIELIKNDLFNTTLQIKGNSVGISKDSPSATKYFHHDGIEWQEMTRQIHSYNSLGLVAKTIYLIRNFSTGKFDTTYSVEFEYTDDLLTQKIRKEYINNSWHPTSKESFNYNIAGIQIENNLSIWTGSAWELSTGLRKEYTYSDDKLYFLTWYSYDATQQQWSAFEKAMVTYNNDDPFSVTFFDMAGAFYFEKLKLDSLEWHDFSKFNLKTLQVYNWDTNQWRRTGKILYQYSPEDKVIHRLWDNYLDEKNLHTNYGYDLSGKLIGFYNEVYDLNNPGLVINDGFRVFEIFNEENKEVMEFIENYDDVNVIWKTDEKYEFEYTPISTGLKSPSKTELTISVYPNPAQYDLNITLAGFKEAVTVTIFDIIGKEVIRKELGSTDKATIDISGLNRGNYIMSVQAEGLNKAVKFVKQ